MSWTVACNLSLALSQNKEREQKSASAQVFVRPSRNIIFVLGLSQHSEVGYALED